MQQAVHILGIATILGLTAALTVFAASPAPQPVVEYAALAR